MSNYDMTPYMQGLFHFHQELEENYQFHMKARLADCGEKGVE